MSAIVPGAAAPPAVFASAFGPVTVPDHAGRPVLLVFFQEASTPRCTAQVRTLYQESAVLSELGAVLYFVSTDEPERQAAFARGIDAPDAPFLYDADGAGARAYGVYDEETGRSRRAVFVIAGDGTVREAIPWYSPENSDQLLSIFMALGWGAGDPEVNENG